jgi:hypothetical protein
MTRSPSSIPGRSFGCEPVAMTTSVASIGAPSTSSAAPAFMVADPLTTSILRALTSPVSPETSLSTILASKARIASQSGEPEASMPHSLARFTVSMTAAD